LPIREEKNVRYPLILTSLLMVSGQNGMALDSTSFRAATDVTAEVRQLTLDDYQVISAGPDAEGLLFDAQEDVGLPDGVAIDALAVAGSNILFSTDVGYSYGGTDYADEDVAAYNPGTDSLSLHFDGSAAGIPTEADVDAVTFAVDDVFPAGAILFSLDVGAVLPGVGFVDDDDVCSYSGGVFAVVLEPNGTLGVPVAADLDALHWDGSVFYISFDITTTVDGDSGDDEDVFTYDADTGTSAKLSAFNIAAVADLSALDEPLDTDGDWLTDIEESTGMDDPASAIAGSGVPIDPAGNITDPTDADSDEDGASDGNEALAGTGPNNSNSVFRIEALDVSDTTVTLLWSSVPGKDYRVERIDSISPPGVPVVAVPSIPAFPSTTTKIVEPTPAGHWYYRVYINP
jgi:hypothetical protein